MKLGKKYLKYLKGCLGDWFLGDQEDALKEIHRLRRKVKRLRKKHKRWKNGMPDGTCSVCEHWTKIGSGCVGSCVALIMITGRRVTCRRFKSTQKDSE